MRYVMGSLTPLGEFFRASGAFLPSVDPLVPYCNAPMHWGCYGRWPHRERFARAFVEAWVKATRLNPFWWVAYHDEHVLISVNPERPVEEAVVRLCAVGSDIRVPLPKWSDWLAHPDRVLPKLQDLEKRELKKLVGLLRERFPDDHAVVHAIDPAEKRPARERAALQGYRPEHLNRRHACPHRSMREVGDNAFRDSRREAVLVGT